MACAHDMCLSQHVGALVLVLVWRRLPLKQGLFLHPKVTIKVSRYFKSRLGEGFLDFQKMSLELDQNNSMHSRQLIDRGSLL